MKVKTVARLKRDRNIYIICFFVCDVNARARILGRFHRGNKIVEGMLRNFKGKGF